jgi:hypothetical protein
MNPPARLKFALWFLLTYAVLLALSLQFGQRYVELLLPLYRWEIGWIFPDFNIVSLALADNRGEGLVALQLNLVHYIVIAQKLLPPGLSVSSSTLTGHALQHPLLMLSLLAAWPAQHFSQRMVRLLISLPILLLLEMLDVPLVLLGSIEDVILANIANSTSSLLVVWMNFMNGGGRPALSIVAALAAIGGERILLKIQRS